MPVTFALHRQFYEDSMDPNHLPSFWKQTQLLHSNSGVSPMSCISHMRNLGPNMAQLPIDVMTFREVLKHEKLISCIFDIMIQIPIAISALGC